MRKEAASAVFTWISSEKHYKNHANKAEQAQK
jgi:hypothetical protein